MSKQERKQKNKKKIISLSLSLPLSLSLSLSPSLSLSLSLSHPEIEPCFFVLFSVQLSKLHFRPKSLIVCSLKSYLAE